MAGATGASCPPIGDPQYLKFDVGTDMIEARVVVTSTRVTELLQLLLSQSNRHETMLAELQHALAGCTERVATVDAALEDLKPDGDRQQQLERKLESLQVQTRVLRDDLDGRVDRLHERVKQKNDVFDSQLREIGDVLTRDVAYCKQAGAEALQLGKHARERLDALVVPDVAPINANVSALQDSTRELLEQTSRCAVFVEMWHADAATCRKLTATSSSTGAPMFNADAKAEYLASLPAFQHYQDRLKQVQQQCKAHADGINVSLTGKLQQKVGHAEIAEVANAVADAKRDLKKSVDYVDRRLHDQEMLTRSIAGLESKLELLRQTKADASTLELKGDAEVLAGVNYRVTVLREDVNALVDKFMFQEQQTRTIFGNASHGVASSLDTARALATSAGLASQGGSPVSPRQPAAASATAPGEGGAAEVSSHSLRRSSSFHGGGGGALPLSVATLQEECRRKFVELTAELRSLEAKKADRVDVASVREYLVALAGEGSGPSAADAAQRPPARGGGSGGGALVVAVSKSVASSLTPQRPGTAAAPHGGSGDDDGLPPVRVRLGGSAPSSRPATGRHGIPGERSLGGGRWKSPGAASAFDESSGAADVPSIDGTCAGHAVGSGERSPRTRGAAGGGGGAVVCDASGCATPAAVFAPSSGPAYIADRSSGTGGGALLLPPPIDEALTAASTGRQN